MKRKRRLVLLSGLVVVGVVAAGTVSAEAENKRMSNQGIALVGTWDVTLSIPGAPPGRVLATFNSDGTTVESAAVPGTIRGASHGVWERIGSDLFAVTRVFFRFSPTGAFLGTQKVNATVRVAPPPDRNSFTAVSISELRDPSGAIVASGLRGTAQGVRMQVEEIPDRP